MKPLYFGDSRQYLYGVYQMPAGAMNGKAVLICSPVGQEGMRSHRAIRQLAKFLAQAGCHVLRFDYRGVGDSSSELEAVAAEDWLEDIGAAIEEIKSLAHISRVSIIGLRLGSLLAASACASRRDVDELVLWDPIDCGKTFLQEIEEKIIRDESAGEEPCRRGNLVDSQGVLHFNGFAFSPELQQSLQKLRLEETGISGDSKVSMFVSHADDSFESMQNHFSRLENFHYQQVDAAHDWMGLDALGGLILPQPIIRAIVEKVTS